MTGRALVIGMGSAGSRHRRLLAARGLTVVGASRRTDQGEAVYSLSEALSMGPFDYVVVANETSAHHDTLLNLADVGHRGPILVEKPLFDGSQRAPDGLNIYVGYNLRFLPGVLAMRAWLGGRKIVQASLHVGQDLRQWRPGRRLDDSYSADPQRGGGALRDLSHELDLACWLLGPWHRLTSLGGSSGVLPIASDDSWSILSQHANCSAVQISLNYVDNPASRGISVTTESGRADLDLIKGELRLAGQVTHHAVPADASYIAMHEAVLSGQVAQVCTLEEGYRVMAMILAAERSAERGEWVLA